MENPAAGSFFTAIDEGNESYSGWEKVGEDGCKWMRKGLKVIKCEERRLLIIEEGDEVAVRESGVQ